MAEQPRIERKTTNRESQTQKAEIISLARRRALMAGLAVPVILTLRSKPLFADPGKGSTSMSANVSRGIVGPNGNGPGNANGIDNTNGNVNGNGNAFGSGK